MSTTPLHQAPTNEQRIAKLREEIEWNEREYHACANGMEAGKYGAAVNRYKAELENLLKP